MARMFHAWHFTCTCMIPCSLRVKCHIRNVPCVFHGILHVIMHIHMLRETWSMQTQGMNLEYLCHVSLHVHTCKSEVINERYCMYLNTKRVFGCTMNDFSALILICFVINYSFSVIK